MEAQEQIVALIAEKSYLTQSLENVTAEKLALDMAYVTALKECVDIRKNLILTGQKLENSEREKNSHVARIGELNARISELEAKLAVPANSAMECPA